MLPGMRTLWHRPHWNALSAFSCWLALALAFLGPFSSPWLFWLTGGALSQPHVAFSGCQPLCILSHEHSCCHRQLRLKRQQGLW